MSVGALAVALAVALSACGGDDEKESGTSAAEAPTETTESAETATAPTETEAETVPPPTAEQPTETEPSGSPEDQPGGAGDEEPARSLALFTGANGRITPRVIRVPAFISIRVELRATDDHEYGLKFDGHTMRVSGGLSSVATTIDGLRPGAAVVGEPTGGGNRVRIEATAEPGP